MERPDASKAAELGIVAYLGLLDKQIPSQHINRAADLFEKDLDWCESQLPSVTPSPGLSPQGRGEEPKAAAPALSKGPTPLQDLFAWALKHGKQYRPTWVSKHANLPPHASTNDIERVKNELKCEMGWKDQMVNVAGPGELNQAVRLLADVVASQVRKNNVCNKAGYVATNCGRCTDKADCKTLSIIKENA